jgi:hypothetical protein
VNRTNYRDDRSNHGVNRTNYRDNRADFREGRRDVQTTRDVRNVRETRNVRDVRDGRRRANRGDDDVDVNVTVNDPRRSSTRVRAAY